MPFIRRRPRRRRRLCCRRLEGHSLQVRHKRDWDREFILLLHQTIVLPGSDAGNDSVEPASSFVIQNRLTSCSVWCPMYGARYLKLQQYSLQFDERRRTCNSVKEQASFVHLLMESTNTIRKRLILTQAAWSKLNVTGLALVPSMTARILNVSSQCSGFHL